MSVASASWEPGIRESFVQPDSRAGVFSRQCCALSCVAMDCLTTVSSSKPSIRKSQGSTRSNFDVRTAPYTEIVPLDNGDIEFHYLKNSVVNSFIPAPSGLTMSSTTAGLRNAIISFMTDLIAVGSVTRRASMPKSAASLAKLNSPMS